MSDELDRTLRKAMATYVAASPEPPELAAPVRRRRFKLSPATAFAAGFVLVLVVGIGMAVFSFGDSPPPIDANEQPPITGNISAVELGIYHVWPEQPRQVAAEELATAFAVEVLGWDDPVVTRLDDNPSSSPAVVRIGMSGKNDVDLVIAPDATGGRVILQVNTPPDLRGGDTDTNISLLEQPGATGAVATVTRLGGEPISVVVDRDELATGTAAITEIDDVAEVGSILVRYTDVSGEVIGAGGGHYATGDEAMHPARCLGSGRTLPGDPAVGYATSDDALAALPGEYGVVGLDFIREERSDTWIAGSSAQPRAVVELYQHDGSSEWFIGSVIVCEVDGQATVSEGNVPEEMTSLPYRVLVDGAKVGDVYVTDVATTDGELASLWSQLGLVGDVPEVDFATSVVLYFGAVESSSCPLDSMQALIYNDGDQRVYPQIPIADGRTDCRLDAISHAVVVAVDRAALPTGGFSLWIDAGDPPACCTNGLTFVAPGELNPPADATYAPLDAEGRLAIGETRVAYRAYTHCGVEWLPVRVNGQAWKAIDLDKADATGVDPVPRAWGVANDPLDLELTLVDDATIEATVPGSGVTVTYVPATDPPGCA